MARRKTPVPVLDKKTKELLYMEEKGRSRKEDWFMNFDIRKYKADVSMALKDALFDIRNEMVKRMKMRLVAIPFRDRSIPMADGSQTSDLQRKAALIESIVGQRVDGNLRDGVMKVAITAMEDNFKDSHIGFYYEYGTGTQEEEDSPYYLWGEWNPYRGAQIPGQPIVTRGYVKRIGSYARGAGTVKAHNRKGKDSTTWTDMGGNKRISKSVIGGQPITTPGWEIEAHAWFRRTFDEMQDEIMGILKKALFKVNPLSEKYLYVNPKTKINIVKKRR